MKLNWATVNHHYIVLITTQMIHSSNFRDSIIVSNSIEVKLAQLETLYAEQDYTIQSLNDIVAQQDQEISRLNISIEQIKSQLQALKAELEPGISTEFEQPPHY